MHTVCGWAVHKGGNEERALSGDWLSECGVWWERGTEAAAVCMYVCMDVWMYECMCDVCM